MYVIEYLRANPAVFLLFTTLLGLVIGSFLNVVIHRLPIMMERDWRGQCRELLGGDEPPEKTEPYDLVRPRSQCPSCGT